MFMNIKIDFKDSRNMRISSFLLKVANHKAKRFCVVMLTRTTQLTL